MGWASTSSGWPGSGPAADAAVRSVSSSRVAEASSPLDAVAMADTRWQIARASPSAGGTGPAGMSRTALPHSPASVS